ncbi:MAG TPA: two-component regulator propeller domain-containing protein [Thermodesulfobacteriota bacterium]|nr:two-component regulator propeller domain-containing protein [Thermodesulfobacteriota bacterium]
MVKVFKINWQRAIIFLVAISLLIPLNASATQVPTSRTFTVKDGITKGGVVSLFLDQGGYVWVVTRDDFGKGGVNVITREGNIFTYTEDNSEMSERTHQVIFETVEEKGLMDPSKGSIWFATAEGVRRLDRQGNWYIYNSQNSRLPGNQVSALAVDREGNRWIAIANRGISWWSKGGLWRVYTKNDGLCSDNISSIIVDRGGNVWCGSKGQGVCRRDWEGKWQNFSEADSGLIDNTVNTITEDSEGKIWFATNKGLSVFDGKGWMSFTPFNSRIPDSPITAIAVDREGNRWMGTWGEGLCAFKKNGEWQTYTSKNSGIQDNRISTLIFDHKSNLWIGTPSGLTMFPGVAASSAPVKGYGCERLWDFGPPAIMSPLQPEEGIFEWGYTWTNREKEVKKVTVNFALPSSVYQKPLWSYALLSLDETVTSPQGLNYQLKQDSRGNQWLEIQGFFTTASFLCRGTACRAPTAQTLPIEKVPHPFPKSFPEDVKGYLKSTTFLPWNDQELVELARSLIKEGSAGDMYLMARDLVCSPLFRDCAFDYGQSRSDYSFLNSDAMIRAPKQVMEEKRGIGFSKARLLACLARSLNIPSRLILTGNKKVWCELWISGTGWVGADVTFPVYDYVWPERAAFPRKLDLSGETVASLSGEEGNPQAVDWYPDTEATVSAGTEGDMSILDLMPKVSLIILQPASLKEIPIKAKMVLVQGLYALALREGNKEFLLIQDEKGGEKGRWELKESKETVNVEVEGKVILKCTVKKIGEYTVLTPAR